MITYSCWDKSLTMLVTEPISRYPFSFQARPGPNRLLWRLPTHPWQYGGRILQHDRRNVRPFPCHGHLYERRLLDMFIYICLFGLNKDFVIAQCFVLHLFLIVKTHNDPSVHPHIHSYIHIKTTLSGKSSLQLLLLRNTSVRLCLVVQ